MDTDSRRLLTDTYTTTGRDTGIDVGRRKDLVLNKPAGKLTWANDTIDITGHKSATDYNTVHANDIEAICFGILEGALGFHPLRGLACW